MSRRAVSLASTALTRCSFDMDFSDLSDCNASASRALNERRYRVCVLPALRAMCTRVPDRPMMITPSARHARVAFHEMASATAA